jgi:hypothetical protein
MALIRGFGFQIKVLSCPRVHLALNLSKLTFLEHFYQIVKIIP